MVDVPKDIMEAAWAIVNKTMYSGRRADMLSLKIQEALLSERERRTAQGVTGGWPIGTDDEVEALARECDWNNRRYMTTADYAIWCERMRKFARLASHAPTPVAEPPKTHDFVHHPKYPWFCRDCGYAPHEPLKHTQPISAAPSLSTSAGGEE